MEWDSRVEKEQWLQNLYDGLEFLTTFRVSYFLYTPVLVIINGHKVIIV